VSAGTGGFVFLDPSFRLVEKEGSKMSYDLSLYSAKPIDIGIPSLSSDGWLEVSGPMEVQSDDLSEGELAAVGKRHLLWQISISNQNSEQDWSRIEAWLARALISTKGVVIDPQSSTYQTATRRGQLKREAKPVSDPSWLCFWFKDGESFHASGLGKLLDTLVAVLPEALPRRYGDYEPLQSKVAGSDYGPLLAAFNDNPDLLMKAASPFGHIMMSIPCKKKFSNWHPRHFIRRHFLLACIKMEVKPSYFQSIAARDSLLLLFERLSIDLNVVYSEFTGPQHNPWGSWFWDGLPDKSPRAFCIGSEYRSVWPKAEKFGREIGPHHRLFVAARDGSSLPPVPPELLSPTSVPLAAGDRNLQGPPILAQVFPFSFTYSPDKYIW
jgi:hypothetical protein